jgi:hypothetical protein
MLQRVAGERHDLILVEQATHLASAGEHLREGIECVWRVLGSG